MAKPSFLDISPSFLARIYTINVANNKNNVSYTATAAAPIGFSTEENASINIILKIFEPITFPSARPFSPLLDATIIVTSYGREVPIATMVKPTKVSLIPNIIAISEADSTTLSPPNTTKASPPAI